jgi:hypothetical protein
VHAAQGGREPEQDTSEQQQHGVGDAEATAQEATRDDHHAEDDHELETYHVCLRGLRTRTAQGAKSEGYNLLAKHQGRNAFGFRNPLNQRRRIRRACTRQHRQASAVSSTLPA